MTPLNIVTGQVAAMPASNIDTDVIMPKQFLKGINREGLDKGLFYDLRFLPDGEQNPDFILHSPSKKQTKFLVVGPNFGCGSSREHAVWGMKQFGVDVIIGTTFGGIFYDNCFRNGILVLKMEPKELELLFEYGKYDNSDKIELNLELQKIAYPSQEHQRFQILALQKEMLLKGFDMIDQTLLNEEKIQEFELQYLSKNPWLADAVN